MDGKKRKSNRSCMIIQLQIKRYIDIFFFIFKIPVIHIHNIQYMFGRERFFERFKGVSLRRLLPGLRLPKAVLAPSLRECI